MVLVVKNVPAIAGDVRDSSLIPGLGRAPGVGNGNPIQYSCLENPWTEEPARLQFHEATELTRLSERIHAPNQHLNCGVFIQWNII